MSIDINTLTDIIVSNSVRCNSCGDEIFSRHRHDFVTCSCDSVSVDGGQEYLRRVYKPDTDATDISIVMYKTTIDKCLEAMQWADDTGRNERGKLYAILRALRDSGVELNDR